MIDENTETEYRTGAFQQVAMINKHAEIEYRIRAFQFIVENFIVRDLNNGILLADKFYRYIIGELKPKDIKKIIAEELTEKEAQKAAKKEPAKIEKKKRWFFF